MGRGRELTAKDIKKSIEQYDHADKTRKYSTQVTFPAFSKSTRGRPNA